MKWLRPLLILFLRLPPLVVMIVPPLALCLLGFNGFLKYLDRMLTQATPLVAYEASAVLKREVQIGKLTPNLTVNSLWNMIRHPESYGAIPVAATDLMLGNKPHEVTYAGTKEMFRVRRVTAYVSLPDVLGGNINGAVPRVVIESPDVTLVRNPLGVWNLLEIVPKKDEEPKPQPPFRTVVEVWNARIRWRDYASSLPYTGQPTINSLSIPKATADLSGTRLIRFEAEGAALPGSNTQQRLGGLLKVQGSMARVEAESYPGSPSRTAPKMLIRLDAAGADAAYWFYYFLKPIEGIQVTAGRADATVYLAAPASPPFSASKEEKHKPQPLNIRASVRFREAAVRTTLFSQPVTNANGTLDYEDGALLVNASARAWGEGITATAELWDLTPELPTGNASPQFSARVDVDRFPISRALAEFTPKGTSMPKGLSLAGVATVRAWVSGPAGDPSRIAAHAIVSGVDASYSGYPAIQSVSADVSFAGGVLEARDIKGTIAGGGRVTGKAVARLVANPRQGGKAGDTVFDAVAKGVDLKTIAALDGLTKSENARLRLVGTGDVTAIGRLAEGKLHVVADAVGRNIALGDLAFPVAEARARVDGDTVRIEGGRLEGRDGIAYLNGDIVRGKELRLNWRTQGINLPAVGNTLNLEGVSGIVTASGVVSGTVETPRLVVEDILGLNIRYTTKTDDGGSRRFAADVVSGADIEITKQGVELGQPLNVDRFPARAQITGGVRDLFPAKQGAKADPLLDLRIAVSNLEFEEVQAQIGGLKAVVPAAPENPPAFSAALTRATIAVTGRVSKPVAQGFAAFESSLLLGPYPVERASFQFRYDDQGTRISNAALLIRSDIKDGVRETAAVKGDVLITPEGSLKGSFRTGTFRLGETATDTIDVARFAFLLGGKLRLEGQASAQGTIAGTLKAPQVGLTVDSPELLVAGLPVTGLKLNGRLTSSPNREGANIIEVTALKLAQGSVDIDLKESSYDPETGDLSIKGDVVVNQIKDLITALRRSDLAATEGGEKIIRALSQFPESVNGRVAVRNLVTSGRLVDGKLEKPKVSGNVRGERLQIGDFTTDSLTADVAVDGEVVRVSNLEAKTATTTIRGNGVYDPDGTVNVLVESNDFDLGALRSLPDFSSFPLKGSVGFTLAVQGKSAEPSITASLDGKEIEIVSMSNGGQPFVLSSVRLVSYIEKNAKGQYELNIPDAAVTRGQAEVKLDARLPFALDPEEPGLESRPIEVNVTVPRLDLTAFADLLRPQIAAATPQPAPKSKGKKKEEDKGELGGVFEARVTLGGTLKTPALSGFITLTDGKFRMARPSGSDRDLVSPIRDLDMNLRLGGNRIYFDQASFEKASAPASPIPGVPNRVDLTPGDKRKGESTFLALGGINGQRGDFGTVELTGSIAVENLSDLQNLLRRQEPGRRPRGAAATQQSVTLGGSYNLAATFRKFTPVAENLLAGAAVATDGDYFKSRIDGTVHVTGNNLLEPIFTTAENEPLRLTNLEFRVPGKGREPQASNAIPAFRPSFGLAFELANDAKLYNSTFFNFRVKGNASLTGPLYRPEVIQRREAQANAATRAAARTTPTPTPTAPRTQAPPIAQEENPLGFAFIGEFQTTGGELTFPTALFRIQRNGIVDVRFGNVNGPGISATNVIAKTRVYPYGNTLNNVNSGPGRDAISSLPGGSSQPSATRQTQGYDITITINRARVDLSEDTQADVNIIDPSTPSSLLKNSMVDIDLESNPPLSEDQIISLIIPIQQGQLARDGRYQDAFKSFTMQALTSSVLPGQVAKLTQGLANSLGLEDLTIDYNPDTSPGVRLLKRLSPPFDKVVVDVTRTFPRSGQGTSVLQPYIVTISYEIFQFRRGPRGYQPRVQMGVTQNEQRIMQYFLRGTISF